MAGCEREPKPEKPAVDRAIEGKEVTLTDANFDEIVLQSSQPVLVDFWAPWCGPCMAIGPVVEDLSIQHDGRLVVGKVNIDENPELANRFEIQAIPLFLLFRDGKEIDRLSGANRGALIGKVRKTLDAAE
ncbi:MAG: thioredoxin [Planctomycetales bacterium]